MHPHCIPQLIVAVPTNHIILWKRSWKVWELLLYFFSNLFSRQLAIIEKERSPRVLVIHHSDEEEPKSEEEEEEGFGGMKSDSSDEDQEEDKLCDCLATGSPDSSFQSLSPGEILNA